MAVKASVDTSNQTTVRVGQQNAIQVPSSQFGTHAVTADTAFDVVGGRADVSQLVVSGLSTFTGIVTTVDDVYVGGNLFTQGELVLDNIAANNLNISGISSVGSAITMYGATGIISAAVYYGDGSKLVGTGDTTNISTNSLVVLGISTLGVTSVTDFETQQLSVSGISTFNENVKFIGNHTNMRWNHDTSDLTLWNNTRLVFGDNTDFQIWHGGTHTFVKNTGGDLRIRGDRILLKREDDTEIYLVANKNQDVTLFYNGLEKFSTTLQGVEIGKVAISTVGFVTATDVWVSGAVTATTYYGDSLFVSGISTFGGNARFDGNVSIGGTLTYEDVTNIDSVGIITARKDVRVGRNFNVTGVSTFSGNINANGNIVGDNSTNITGIDGVTATSLSGTLQTAAQPNITSLGTLTSATVSGDINANGNIVGDNATNISGINSVTATEFYGSGANLIDLPTGINTGGTSTFKTIVVNGNAGIGSLNVTGVSTFAGITTVTGDTLFAKNTNFSGISTFYQVSVQGPLFFLDCVVQRHLSVSGISTFQYDINANGNIVGDNSTNITGIAGVTASTLNISGISTLGITSTTNLEAQQLNVTGISTLGITSTTNLISQQLSVSGLSTYIGVATYKSNVFVDGTLTAGAIDGGTY